MPSAWVVLATTLACGNWHDTGLPSARLRIPRLPGKVVSIGLVERTYVDRDYRAALGVVRLAGSQSLRLRDRGAVDRQTAASSGRRHPTVWYLAEGVVGACSRGRLTPFWGESASSTPSRHLFEATPAGLAGVVDTQTG
jgi:hypothetical protein